MPKVKYKRVQSDGKLIYVFWDGQFNDIPISLSAFDFFENNSNNAIEEMERKLN